MGVVPSPVNNTANAINEAIQIAIFDVALTALKAFAVASLPWLGWPVINQIFNFLVNTVGKYFYKFLSQVATFTVIDMQTSAELAGYSQALNQLQAAFNSGDQNEISKATASVKLALASLIHFDGSANLQLRAHRRLRQSHH